MSAPARTITCVATTRLFEPPHPGCRRHHGLRFVVALTFLGLVLNMVITVDPGSAGLTAPSVHRAALAPLTHVETVPMATAAAVARAAGTVSSAVPSAVSSAVRSTLPAAVAGLDSPSPAPRSSTTALQALTSLAAPPAPSTGPAPATTAPATTAPATTELPVATALTIDAPGTGSLAGDESALSRIGASLTAVVSGLIPVVPPVLPLTTMRHIAAEATSSSGFSGPEDGPGPAILVLVGVCLCAAFPARRVTDDRARLAWSFVAPLLRPG